MRKYLSFLMTNESVVIIFEDGFSTICSDNPYCEKIKKFLLKGQVEEAVEAIDISSRLQKHTNGRFYLQDGVVMLDGECLPMALSNRLLKFVDADLPYEPLINFWNNLKENPSEESKKDLYGFLEHNGIPITADGYFIAYKRVTGDWKDVHTKSFDNSVGTVVKMPREDVDADREQTCSKGLHVAAYKYADGFYPNGILVEVKVNPRDVVAVPVDYNNEKMRVCEYEVIKFCEGERQEALYEYFDEDFDDEEDAEDFYNEDVEVDEYEDEDEDVDVEVDGEVDEGLIVDNAVVHCDLRGRICIPKSVISGKLGLSPGDKVFVWTDYKKIYITDVIDIVPVSIKESTVYSVDKSSNVRISNSIIEKAGLNSNKEFEINFIDNEGYLEIV